MEKYIITKDIFKKVRRFNLMGRTIEFKIKPIPKGHEAVRWVKRGIEEILERGVEGVDPTDLVGLTFCSKEFSRGQGWINFKMASELKTDDVWDVISGIYQSNSSGFNTETFCLGVTSIKLPTGRGLGRCYSTFNEECAMRKGIITIINKDNLCLPRALVVARAFVEKDPDYSKVRRDTGKIQGLRAKELIEAAGVTIPETGCGIQEIGAFQKHLTEYTITVYAYGRKGRDVIYKGAGGDKRLNLLHHEGHYNVMTSLTAAFCCNYYCEECHIPYNTKGSHRCQASCPACFQTPKCPQAKRVACDKCHRTFRGPECFEKHTKTICDTVHRCIECFKTVRNSRQHTCGEIYCRVCQKYVPTPHQCFIQVDKGQPKTKDLLFIFYDLETRQEREKHDGLLHEPNLCCFKQVCSECINGDKEICGRCGLRVQRLLCDDPIPPFVRHVFTMRKSFKKVVVIAHNAGSFDHQFLLRHILTETDLKPSLIMRGTKLIVMEVENVKFLDSINYFPMALAKLPKAFGLVALKKGYFPHLFNKSENLDYVGPIPPIEYFDIDNLKEDVRQDIISWHTKLSSENYIFDFKKEFVDYCISDVEILAAACLKFRQQLMAVGNVCPFTEATTIASACNKVFRRNFLKPSTIGIIPKNGYRWGNRQSKCAIKWLICEERERQINILHAAKGEEVEVAGVKVDGYAPETRQVFEFQGCYYHGCPRCFKHQRMGPCYDDPDVTPESRYEATLAKTTRLRQKGYEVIEMWECDFKRQLQSNVEMSTYTASHPMVYLTPLNPRDCLYGGRTGAAKLYYECKEGEKIKYVDVCSLYPWVCKYGKFPIGHPNVLVGEECSKQPLSTMDGVIKCKILPPQNLYHPVLPAKMNDKLMFVLCRTCGEDFNSAECTHSEEQRALVGTWVLDEVKKALEKGYRILEIYEIWNYPNIEQFDKLTKSGGLFSEMMNKFIKVKQQASGWPKNCNSDEERHKYIEKFFEMEDIRLEFNEILENPGLRSLAKLMLNSFWGKFGQRENQSKTTIVNSPEEFYDLLTNPATSVNTVLPVDENTLVVTWCYKEEVVDPLPTVNVVLAAFVTAQARLKLYSYLESLNERVLYYDTDSVIYISRPGENDIPIGSFIGEMTDELEGYGLDSFITEFVSGGPKLYAYRVFSPLKNESYDTIKVKGITINYRTSNQVNFEKLRDMVLNEEPPEYITTRNILRTSAHEVVTKETTKIFRVNFRKRKIEDAYDSFPFGFKRSRQNE